MSDAQYSDRARRMSGIVTLAMLANGREIAGRWMAFRLSDGGSDEKIYDKKADAVRFQLHEQQCAYVCLTPDGMSPRSADNFLRFNEGLYKVGWRLQDPDQHMHAPTRTEDNARIIRAVSRRR